MLPNSKMSLLCTALAWTVSALATRLGSVCIYKQTCILIRSCEGCVTHSYQAPWKI